MYVRSASGLRVLSELAVQTRETDAQVLRRKLAVAMRGFDSAKDGFRLEALYLLA